jgi:predicted MarR family transcription regulator
LPATLIGITPETDAARLDAERTFWKVEMVNKERYDLEAMAKMLRAISGIYEQASRSVASGPQQQ